LVTDTPRFLIVRRLDDRSEVKRVDVTGHSEHSIERIMVGMLRNLNEACFVADSADEEV
jgi:hypothetical protein